MAVAKRAGNDTFHKFWLSGGLLGRIFTWNPLVLWVMSLWFKGGRVWATWVRKNIFSDIQSVTLKYHTHRHTSFGLVCDTQIALNVHRKKPWNISQIMWGILVQNRTFEIHGWKCNSYLCELRFSTHLYMSVVWVLRFFLVSNLGVVVHKIEILQDVLCAHVLSISICQSTPLFKIFIISCFIFPYLHV